MAAIVAAPATVYIYKEGPWSLPGGGCGWASLSQQEQVARLLVFRSILFGAALAAVKTDVHQHTNMLKQLAPLARTARTARLAPRLAPRAPRAPRRSLRRMSTASLNTTADNYFVGHLQTGAEPYRTPSFANNQLFWSLSSQWYDIHDPATAQVVGRVPQSTESELDSAIESAAVAFDTFKQLSVIKRQQILFKFVQLLRANHDRLASVIVLESGKTWDDAKGDVLRGLQVAEYAVGSGCTTELMGQLLEVSRDMETKMVREPLGVVASICPFNFPAMIPLWTIPLAIATGNTMVLKPSERVPGAAVIIAELAREAGVPEGVLNVVHGKHPTVNKLLGDERIQAVTFVGSNAGGEHVHKTASSNGKRVQANLGAKNHLIVMDDADRAQVIRSVAGAAFGAAGQRCMAVSVAVTVGASTNRWFVDGLVEEARKLKVGSGFDKASLLGPMITLQALQRAGQIIDETASSGQAQLLLDGRGVRPDGEQLSKGFFLGPTILNNVDLQSKAYTEEIFGPVLCVVNVDTLDEAIALVNGNPYGNGVALFTASGRHAKKFEKQVNVGQVGVNVPIPVPLPMFGFTGSRKSFLGDLNFYGKSGLWFMTKPKTITSLWKTELPEKRSHAQAHATSMPTHE